MEVGLPGLARNKGKLRRKPERVHYSSGGALLFKVVFYRRS